MRVLIAGGTGAIGVPIVQALLSAQHHVTGIVRTEHGAATMHGLGADAIQADVLDRDALMSAVADRRYDAVVHELTALKKAPIRYRDMRATNELRTRGTRHLLEVAHEVGATRFVTQSIVLGYGYQNHGPDPVTESTPFGRTDGDKLDHIIEAMAYAENAVFDDPAVEGIALRYGLFYGRDVADMAAMLRKRRLPVTTAGGTLGLVHHDDAAAATVAALERGVPDTAYNIVDDTPVSWRDYVTAIAVSTGAPAPRIVPAWLVRSLAPYAAALMTRVSMKVSNARARDGLGWAPRYPSCTIGLRASAALGGS